MGTVAYKGIIYGGGSDVEANPAETATGTLTKVGIDGTVYDVSDADAVHSADVGEPNGVAELDENGLVLSSQLPSYVDDVLEYASVSAFPATGESGKIYVALDTNLTYRWSGSAYVEISPSLALGETSSTAYRGDRGKTAYDHATESGRSGAKSAGLYKIGVTAQGHVASTTAVAKADLTALGVADQNDVDAIEADIEGFKTVTGEYITITDGAELPAKNYSITLSPVQSLNGYDSPWVGGAGKNKLQVTASTDTINGLTFTVNADGTVKVTGTASATTVFKVADYAVLSQDMKLNGCPTGGGGSSYALILNHSGNPYYDSGNGVTIPANTSLTYAAYQIRIASGYAIPTGGLLFKPMLRLATVADSTFAPYSNICPIHGADEVGVRVCGFNLFDNNTFVKGRLDSGIIGYADNTTAMTITDSGVDFTTNANYRGVVGGLIEVKSNTDYYLTYTYNGSITVTRSVDFYDKNGDWLYRMTPFTNPFTTPSDCRYIRIAFQLNSSGSASITDICVNISTPTGTPKDGDYVPYNAHSTTITLPSTVYGGSVDMGGSGEVTKAIYTIPTITEIRQSGDNKFVYINIPSIESVTGVTNDIVCDRLGFVSVVGDYFGLYHISGTIVVSLPQNYTVEEYNAQIAGGELVYPLATPTDISVTPFPQTLLEGVNNVWAEMKENSVVIDNAQQSLSYQPQNIVGQLRQEIEAKPDSFAQLSDTSFSNLANGQIPKWNSTTSKWENANESGGGGASSLAELSDTNISSPGDGHILKWDDTTSKWVNAAEYSYTLPTASASTKGGIKVGDNLAMDGEVLSAKTVPWTLLGTLSNNQTIAAPSGFTELLIVVKVGSNSYFDAIFPAAIADFSSPSSPDMYIPVYNSGNMNFSAVDGFTENNIRYYGFTCFVQGATASLYYR